LKLSLQAEVSGITTIHLTNGETTIAIQTIDADSNSITYDADWYTEVCIVKINPSDGLVSNLYIEYTFYGN